MEKYAGGCACGAVRFEALGRPLRVGLCHCMACRKYHGSAFNPFVVFRFDRVFMAGALKAWRSSNHASRFSCEICSSPLCYREDVGDEIELNMGSFDDSSLFTPTYENWVCSREDWLTPLGVPEFKTDLGYERRRQLAVRH